jgi:hypothetical protein
VRETPAGSKSDKVTCIDTDWPKHKNPPGQVSPRGRVEFLVRFLEVTVSVSASVTCPDSIVAGETERSSPDRLVGASHRA